MYIWGDSEKVKLSRLDPEFWGNQSGSLGQSWPNEELYCKSTAVEGKEADVPLTEYICYFVQE